MSPTGGASLASRMAAFAVIGLGVGYAVGWGWTEAPDILYRLNLDRKFISDEVGLTISIALLVAFGLLMDAVRLPIPASWGHRRSWAVSLIVLAMICTAGLWLAPNPLVVLVLAWATLGIGAALVIAVDALRVETATARHEHLALAGAQVIGTFAGALTVTLLEDGKLHDMTVLAFLSHLALAAYMVWTLPPHPRAKYLSSDIYDRIVVDPVGSLMRPTAAWIGLAAALALATFAHNTMTISLVIDTKLLGGATALAKPALIEAVGSYTWLFSAAGAAIALWAAWRRHPAAGFAVCLVLMMGLLAAIFIMRITGGGLYWAVFLLEVADNTLLGASAVFGMAMIAMACRPPHAAFHFAFFVLIWELVAYKFRPFESAQSATPSEVGLASGVGIVAAAVAALICWRILTRHLPRTANAH